MQKLTVAEEPEITGVDGQPLIIRIKLNKDDNAKIVGFDNHNFPTPKKFNLALILCLSDCLARQGFSSCKDKRWKGFSSCKDTRRRGKTEFYF